MTATTEYITKLEDQNDRLKAQIKLLKEKNAVGCPGEADGKLRCPNCNFDKLKCPRCGNYYTDIRAK